MTLLAEERAYTRPNHESHRRQKREGATHLRILRVTYFRVVFNRVLSDCVTSRITPQISRTPFRVEKERFLLPEIFTYKEWVYINVIVMMGRDIATEKRSAIGHNSFYGALPGIVGIA